MKHVLFLTSSDRNLFQSRRGLVNVMRAIDTFVNVNMGSQERPDYLVRVAEDYFKRAPEIFQDISIDKMLETMDRCGVEKSILSVRAENPMESVLALARARPDRFTLAAYVDPRRGMSAIRALETISAQRAGRAGARRAVHDRPAARRQVLLPALRQVHRAGPADLGQHRHPRPARARPLPGSDLSRRGLSLFPRADAGHGARRRPVVAGRDPPDAQVSATST